MLNRQFIHKTKLDRKKNVFRRRKEKKGTNPKLDINMI